MNQSSSHLKSELPYPDNKRVGILAAWGRYPVIVAEKLKQAGYQTFCAAAKDHADPILKDICDEFCWVGLGRFGKSIRFFQRHQVHHATMAGKIHKVNLYQPWMLLKHLPDWQTLCLFFPHFISMKKDRKDDTLLGAIVNGFAKKQIYFQPATNYAPELLVKAGTLTKRQPTTSQMKDVEFGWKIAKEMGRLDIGQSVIIKKQTVMAVEAIEGTDECIRRAAALCRGSEFTVVKVAKPQQDMRFDVPTIGLQTLEVMKQAGGSVLAIQADQTIVLDEPEVIQFANKNKISIVAIPDSNSAELKATA